MSNTCKFDGCRVCPKNGGQWCSKHNYRAQMAQCEFVKTDGTRCDKLTSKRLCKAHCFNRTPNQCAYIGPIKGRCTNMCKNTYCPTHNPNAIKIRVETTRKYAKQKYDEQRQKKMLLDEIIGRITEYDIHDELSEELCNRIKQLT